MSNTNTHIWVQKLASNGKIKKLTIGHENMISTILDVPRLEKIKNEDAKDKPNKFKFKYEELRWFDYLIG